MFTKLTLFIIMAILVLTGLKDAETQQATPRKQPNAEMTLYTPEQHDLYDGHFVLSAGRLYQVGRLYDPPGWDHMGNDASNVHPVEGTVEIDVNEINNTGRFSARLQVQEGDLILEFDRFHQFSPCQNGGVAAYIYEHGDSGCGDTNWPKSLSTSPAGAMGTRRSTVSLFIRTTKCTSWSLKASGIGEV